MHYHVATPFNSAGKERLSYKVNWLITVSYPGASFSRQAFGEAQGVIGKPKIAKRALRFSLSLP